MNITALRPRFLKLLEPLADICVRLRLTPNQISGMSLLTGAGAAYLFFLQYYAIAAVALIFSALFDLIDGSVARKIGKESHFGAVIDWIFDKYVDMLVLLGIGLSGVAIISWSGIFPPEYAATADFGVVALAIIGSMMNTFIKPVVYAEAGFDARKDGKIDDPLEGIGFFGRPETLIVIIAGGLTGFIWLSVIIVAVCANLSAIQRIIYLYQRLS